MEWWLIDCWPMFHLACKAANLSLFPEFRTVQSSVSVWKSNGWLCAFSVLVLGESISLELRHWGINRGLCDCMQNGCKPYAMAGGQAAVAECDDRPLLQSVKFSLSKQNPFGLASSWTQLCRMKLGKMLSFFPFCHSCWQWTGVQQGRHDYSPPTCWCKLVGGPGWWKERHLPNFLCEGKQTFTGLLFTFTLLQGSCICTKYPTCDSKDKPVESGLMELFFAWSSAFNVLRAGQECIVFFCVLRQMSESKCWTFVSPLYMRVM